MVIRKSASLTTHMGQLILYSFIVSSLPPPDFQSSVSRGVCLKYEDKCSLFLEADTSIGATIGSRHHISLWAFHNIIQFSRLFHKI